MSSNGMSVEDLKEQLNEQSDHLARQNALLRQRVTELEEQLEELQAEVSTAQSTAGTALAVVNQETEDESEMSKTRVAYLKARDELVKRAAVDESSASGQGVTIGDVQQMATPEYTLYHQQVKNAFGQLVEEWDCFDVGKNEDDLIRLQVRKDALEKELVQLVEESLGRDDLVKRLFDEPTNGGGS